MDKLDEDEINFKVCDEEFVFKDGEQHLNYN